MKRVVLITLAILLTLVALILEPYFMAPTGTSYSLPFYLLSTQFKLMYVISDWMGWVPQFRQWRINLHLKVLNVTFTDADLTVVNETLRYDSTSPMYYDLDESVKGSADVPMRVIAPVGATEKLPLYFFLHGGGWQLNHIDTYHNFLKNVARSGYVVVAANYRKAPEYPFPQPFNDCVQALIWAFENAEKYGADPSKIIISGDSAGGNLAAAVTLYLRDKPYKNLKLSYQVLLYPAVYYPCHNPLYFESYRQYYRYGYVVDGRVASMMWRAFAGKYHDKSDELPYLSPLNAKSFKDLPPAFFILAEHDPLRSEGEEYAKRLQQAGIDVKLTIYPDSYHGFATGNKAVVEDIKKNIESILSIQ